MVICNSQFQFCMLARTDVDVLIFFISKGGWEIFREKKKTAKPIATFTHQAKNKFREQIQSSNYKRYSLWLSDLHLADSVIYGGN